MNKRALAIFVSHLALLGGCGTHTSIGAVAGGGGGGGQGGGQMLADAASGGQGGTVMAADALPDVTTPPPPPPGCRAPGTTTPWSQPASTVSFRAGGTYPLFGNWPYALGDLTGDGKTDIVVTSDKGTSLFLNKGDGSLVGPHNYVFVGMGPVLGDINGDGITDVVFSQTGGVGVLINEGNAALEPPVTYVAGVDPTIALGDLNGDGKMDIATAGGQSAGAGSLTAFFNTGGGTFSAKTISTEGAPSAITIGDVDGDCKPDVVIGEGVQDKGWRLTILLNDGQGTFKAGASYGVGIYAVGLKLVDVNGDGKTDIVVGNGTTSNVDVLINYGDGTFTAAVDYAGSGLAFDVGDLNGDGKPDIAASGGILLNKGNGTFAQPIAYPPVSTNLPGVALADIDGDGKLDAVLEVDGNLNVLFNTSP
jgi:hypothetical protein